MGGEARRTSVKFFFIVLYYFSIQLFLFLSSALLQPSRPQPQLSVKWFLQLCPPYVRVCWHNWHWWIPCWQSHPNTQKLNLLFLKLPRRVTFVLNFKSDFPQLLLPHGNFHGVNDWYNSLLLRSVITTVPLTYTYGNSLKT